MISTINRLFIIAGTLIMIYVMGVTGKSLKTPATPMGIVDLELAFDTPKTASVITAWTAKAPGDTDNISAAIRNTWLDFIFLFFYSFLLFSSCIRISLSFSGTLRKTGSLVAVGALYAGLLDIGENAGMLFTLNGFSSGTISLITAGCSVIKWILVFAALSYLLFTGPFYLLKKTRKP